MRTSGHQYKAMKKVYTDGASRGNPGPAACSYQIKDENDKRIASCVFFLGQTTNNVAEYTAIIHALSWASHENCDELQVYSDSQLVIRQITGVYRINKPHLKALYDEVMALAHRFGHITWEYVPRTHPDIAYCDKLCNEELDRHP
ncbi:MAG TPA: ribonuclease HI family protein [Methanospirillum sp.]|uniref:ribonuclease HI family protein n=1 Tax=Methanospirillum sp. TaxID=45200 RepID=UPI002B931B10|nr:ribonuclease HI family protein [Methanospirillum sp.]HOJ97039.1 ribonuclease HI family protein [Methanospirillum sp.]HOL41461.1 ribonuclease HI family protein [Methanospirillum sp.]HPP76614.1 ribonuclease HI family protein [Methanospirillum sp.]